MPRDGKSGKCLKKEALSAVPLFSESCFWPRATGRRLKAGTIHSGGGSTVAETISVLKNGKEEVVRITVPEGFTAVQIADVLQKAGLECHGDFLHEAETYAPFPYMYGPEAAKVKGEGFLFADTYEIPKSCSARQIADMMYRRTDEMLTPALRKRAEERHLSIHALADHCVYGGAGSTDKSRSGADRFCHSDASGKADASSNRCYCPVCIGQAERGAGHSGYED